jgi:hypothetical protein
VALFLALHSDLSAGDPSMAMSLMGQSRRC